MTPAEELEQLANKTNEVLQRVLAPPLLVEARAALNEVGIVAARRALENAITLIDAAQAQKRRCDAEEQDAKDVYTQALFEAEWELDSAFVTEANKFYLVEQWCEACKGTGEGEGLAGSQCAVCKGKRFTKARQVLAEDKARYKAQQAFKVPAVALAKAALAAKTEASREADDQIDLAERTFSARKYDLTGAVAQLEMLRAGLSIKEHAA